MSNSSSSGGGGSSRSLNVSELDAAARDVQQAQMSARLAQHLATELLFDISQGGHELPQHTTDGSTAADHARLAAEAATDALRRLQSLGAEIPSISGTATRAPDVPLHLLDTPAMRRLLSLVEEAASAALDVDKERRWMHEDGTPAGYGDTLGGFAAKLRTEIYGPATGRE